MRIIFIIFCVIGGLLSYWMLRNDIVLFSWLNLRNEDRFITNGGLYSILNGHLADIFWAIAVYQTTLFFIVHQIHRSYILLLLALPTASECLQALSFWPGTFDFIDLLLYLTILLLHARQLKCMFLFINQRSMSIQSLKKTGRSLLPPVIVLC